MNSAYMRNKWRQNPQWNKCLLRADMCITHGTGAAQCRSHLLENPGHRSQRLPISHRMSLPLQLEVPIQPSAFGTWPLPYHGVLHTPIWPWHTNTAKESGWKEPAGKFIYQNQGSPHRGGTQLLMYEGLRTAWWHLHLVSFSLFSLFH